MKRECKRWTSEEERVLRDQVKRRPNNLSEAFRRTAILVDRTPNAVSFHWYKMRKNTATCFMTVSNGSINPNSKNVVGEDTSMKSRDKSWWRNLLRFLKLK